MCVTVIGVRPCAITGSLDSHRPPPITASVGIHPSASPTTANVFFMTVYSSFEPSVISVVIQRRHVIHLASRQLRLGRNRLRQPDSPARFACELRLYRFGPAEVEAPEIRCS